jgi:GTP-binding protein HflX
MRALTGSEVLVEDKLFATLDTTVRALKPETSPRILISDTVGFIKKLPHDLVASFRSTLDEALNASLLLYIVDAGDPALREQLKVVDDALKEVGVKNTPVMLVFNKIDTVPLPQRKVLQREFPDSLQLSALDEADVARLRQAIVDFFEKRMKHEELFVPYGKEGVIGEIHENTKVLRETHEELGVRFLVRSEASALNRLKKKLER